MGGEHDDEPGEQGVHYNVPCPEGEEEGGLDRLHDLGRVHPVLRQKAALVPVLRADFHCCVEDLPTADVRRILWRKLCCVCVPAVASPEVLLLVGPGRRHIKAYLLHHSAFPAPSPPSHSGRFTVP